MGGLGRKRRLSGQNIEEEIASHVHHLSPNPSLALPPVEPSRQLSSSPNPSLSSSSTKRSRHGTSKPGSTPLKIGLEEDIEPMMRSAGSMQTPPPTSTSASRRKTQQIQAAKLTKQSTASARRMSTPTVPKTTEALASQVEESPLQLGSLQFSPDGFAFSTSGPATAPVYPQHKLFWDPDQNTDGMHIDFPNDDPFTFGLGAQKGLDPFVSNSEQTVSQLPSSSTFDDFNPRGSDMTDVVMSIDLETVHQPDFLPASGLMIKGSSAKFPGKGVNPSLLFSSPGALPAQPATTQVHHNDALQPYAHQIRDAQLENEQNLNRKSKKRRKPQVDSPAVKAALKVLREDNDLMSDDEISTDNIAGLSYDSRSRTSRSLHSSEIPKRKSRRRRTSTRCLAIAKPKKRPVVTLTIDADGRAKTEAKTVYDDDASSSNAQIEMDSASEESETSSSSGSTVMIISQPQSFSLPTQKHQNPKLARFATDSKTHSQKSSYASTLASSKTANSMPVPDGLNPRRITRLAPEIDVRKRSHSKTTLNRVPSSTTISEDMDSPRGNDGGLEIENGSETALTSDDDKGDAQFELKKIVRNRAHDRAVIYMKGQEGAHRGSIPHGNTMTLQAYHGSLPPSHGRPGNVYDSISPTTLTDPDLTTPSTGQESRVSDTRCVCHAFEADGDLMILW